MGRTNYLITVNYWSMHNLRMPIFIVGHPRSGTTLLQCMLSAHSRLTSLPETHFFSRGLPQAGLSPTGALSAEDALRLLNIIANRLPLDIPEAQAALAGQPAVPPRDVFAAITAQYPGADGARLVEKTPIHALHLREIIAAFPDAVFIHLIRDPRDVIRSALRMPIAVSQWIPFYIDTWNRVQAAAHRFAAEHPGILHTLRYEDLTAAPRPALKSICRFLGLAFEGAMVEDFAAEYERNVVPGAESWKSGVAGGEVRSAAGKWKTDFTAAEVWLIETGCRHWMAQYGYAQVGAAGPRQKAAIVSRTLLTGFRERRRPLHWLRRFARQASQP